MNQNQYVIHSQSERGFWSNHEGWVSDIYGATRYMYDEVFNKNGEVISPNIRTKDDDACWIVVAYED